MARFGIVAVLLLCLTGIAWADIAVYPLSIEVPVPPGKEATVGFWVENVGSTAADVRITLHDWFRTPEGKLQVLPPGTLEGSCAAWITCSHTTIAIPPGEKVWVSIVISAPEDAIGDRWALFLVTEYPPEERPGEGMGTRVLVAYAVKLLRRDPDHASPAGEIRSVEVLGVHPLKLRIHYVNTGNAHTKNSGTVEVRDIFGETVRSFSIDEFPTLPGEERVLVVEDPTGEPLPEGVYYAFATVDFGGEYLVRGGIMFQVPLPSE
ncbi:hypothetical protein DRJ27_02275 [Candidatus Acetothermia bacterium]|nr:MAG: hypothetical protein DRJ27_02275 [Candidatus Acetothermia bacterium]